uniref:Uncharacterized protein n=1 Tax=Anguilla anguilla TaxID=7936 RepID=A0A0E9TVK5_ANGAN
MSSVFTAVFAYLRAIVGFILLLWRNPNF